MGVQPGQLYDLVGAHDGIDHQHRPFKYESSQQRHGNGGEESALAVGGGVNDEDDEVQNGLGEQGGGVAGQTVLNGAHDGHGADANGDKTINTKDLILIRSYVAEKDPVTGESSVVLGPY